jgi:predicted glycoside hydrolase/deacetylase ChbG (UPF0249 family)
MLPMTERYLIVNADDFNTHADRNRGILEAAAKGIVTSTTIMANMPGLKEALPGLLRTFGNRIGIHLNLTMGRPLTSGAASLVTPSGSFPDKRTAWKNALFGRMDLGQVEREFAAQIALLRNSGVRPDHIDGNNHIHVFPGVVDIAARLANDFGITKIRLPSERFWSAGQFLQPGAIKKGFFGLLSGRGRSLFKSLGLRFTDHFAGIQFPVVSRIDSLGAFLESLPKGTTELMCHPGYRSPAASPFSSFEREEELSCLTNPGLVERVRALKIHLISYGEIDG